MKKAAQDCTYHAARAIEELDLARSAAGSTSQLAHEQLSRLHLLRLRWLRSVDAVADTSPAV